LFWFKVVHNGSMSTKHNPPQKPDKIRLTIPVSREVHEVFSRYAKAGNISIGRAMGGWLQDTLQSAEFVSSAMERARESPRMVALEIDAYARGLADETGALMKRMKAAGAAAEGARSRDVAADASDGLQAPPPCNTGGKVPKNTVKKHKGES
jgi:hypothetical protein